ncbi:primase-helicase family protein [Ralstonia sp.]|uniref:primase-helicase family protein n=1 Tax=Ralstonia sp. TaxID=54061 RepID=UPI002B72EC26|nr:primase-helicase family protein [Ralstonia sp.]HWV02970.1 primase-helicase family protein [Ralstonia sp.]
MAQSANPQFATFSRYLATCGWCFLANEKYTTVRLYNRFTRTTPPEAVLPTMFRRWDATNASTEGLTGYLKHSLPLVFGHVFQPNGEDFVERHGTLWCNTYQQFEPVTDSADVHPDFLEFLERLFPDDSERHQSIQWLAHGLRKPEERPSYHLLLISESGTGKGFLFNEILKPLLIHTSIAPSFSRVTAQFSTVLEDNLLCLLDDPRKGSDETMTRMKSILSEEWALVEHKGETARMVPTFTRFILASNLERPLRLDEDDRRWFAPKKLVHRVSKEETQQFLSRLYSWLQQSDSLSRVYNWFMQYDLDGFNPKHIPQTDQLRAMIAMSRNALDDVYADFFAENPVLHVSDLQAHIVDAGYTKPQNAAVNHALVEGGYRSQELLAEGKRARYWVRKELDRKTAQTILDGAGQACTTPAPF